MIELLVAKRKFLIFILILSSLILIGAACRSKPAPQTNMSQRERIQFQTADQVMIRGEYQTPESPQAYVLLLHMMPADRTSWYPFMEKLKKAGFASLAIDLRGHGESINQNGRQLDYKKFSDAEHRASLQDAAIALEWLNNEKGADVKKIILIGASIGANLSLQVLAQNKNLPAAVLLSPGLNYRGIETIPLAKKINTAQSVYIIAAMDDERSGGPADKQAQQIYQVLADQKKIEILETGGHGTMMFEDNPELMDEIIDWLEKI